MGSEDNANLVRRGYAAFSTGDMATLNELFADDAVWHVPGSGSLSGAKHGRDAILAFFGELMARSSGTIKITLHDVVAGDDTRSRCITSSPRAAATAWTRSPQRLSRSGRPCQRGMGASRRPGQQCLALGIARDARLGVAAHDAGEEHQQPTR